MLYTVQTLYRVVDKYVHRHDVMVNNIIYKSECMFTFSYRVFWTSNNNNLTI